MGSTHDSAPPKPILGPPRPPAGGSDVNEIPRSIAPDKRSISRRSAPSDRPRDDSPHTAKRVSCHAQKDNDKSARKSHRPSRRSGLQSREITILVVISRSRVGGLRRIVREFLRGRAAIRITLYFLRHYNMRRRLRFGLHMRNIPSAAYIDLVDFLRSSGGALGEINTSRRNAVIISKPIYVMGVTSFWIRNW